MQAAWEPTLEDRLQRLERIWQNQSLSDILLQVRRLRGEVQKLRGILEVQEHTLEALRRRQREQSRKLDSRIGNEQAAATPPVSAPSPSSRRQDSTPAPPATPLVTSARPPLKGEPGDPAKEMKAYKQAFDLLKSGNYSEAVTAFRAFLAAYPNGSYSDNAQYWLGEASYVVRDFDTAMLEFKRVLERYPSSNKVAGATLKLGFIYHERGQVDQARAFLEQVIQRFPGSTEARLAQQRLDLLHRRGR